jgi:predicted ArsR family transcriptional regulator
MVRHDTRDLTRELSEDLIPPESSGSDEDVEVPPEVEDWVEDTKGVERIVSVAITTSKPRTAEWIADQALVSEQTARDHLETFAELGVVASFTSSGVTRYHADEAFIHYREVSRCVEQYSKDKLSDEVEEIKIAIDDLKETHGVDSPDDLRAKAAAQDTDTETVKEYKKSAAEWDSLRDRLAVLEDAIRRFEKFDHPTTAKV